jgi:competence protein ComFC
MYISQKEAVAGKDIILIDDVTTTGATLFEAHKILKQAGAQTVRAITLAH